MADDNKKPADVQLPGDPIDDTAKDVAGPAVSILLRLNLIGTPDETTAAGTLKAAFTGPSQGVAVIEAGATALSKVWASGLAASGAATWALVRAFWGKNTGIHEEMIWAAGIVTAGLLLAVSYIVSSDVKARADAAVAVIRARTDVAVAVIAQSVENQTPVSTTSDAVPMPQGITARYLPARGTADEQGWQVLMIRPAENVADGVFLVAKAGAQHWAKAGDLEFA